jgi:hypothetical protein
MVAQFTVSNLGFAMACQPLVPDINEENGK